MGKSCCAVADVLAELDTSAAHCVRTNYGTKIIPLETGSKPAGKDVPAL